MSGKEGPSINLGTKENAENSRRQTRQRQRNDEAPKSGRKTTAPTTRQRSRRDLTDHATSSQFLNASASSYTVSSKVARRNRRNNNYIDDPPPSFTMSTATRQGSPRGSAKSTMKAPPPPTCQGSRRTGMADTPCLSTGGARPQHPRRGPATTSRNSGFTGNTTKPSARQGSRRAGLSTDNTGNDPVAKPPVPSSRAQPVLHNLNDIPDHVPEPVKELLRREQAATQALIDENNQVIANARARHEQARADRRANREKMASYLQLDAKNGDGK